MAATYHVENAPLTFGRCLQDALENSDAPILSAVGQSPMSGAGVLSAIRTHSVVLRSMGFERADRIAYALPDSAGTALLALSIMNSAVAAPINPRLAQAEVENTLRNLKVTSLIVPADIDTPARSAASALGLHTIDYRLIENSYAGHFELLAPSVRPHNGTCIAHANENDHALIVQTSGTTGAAKIVALTHRNLLSMMLANRERLELTSSDRCLGVMPLFHIHGLGAAIVSFLSGSMIHILPEFNVDRFYAALKEIAPTWYTAVPTIHQSVLRAASAHQDIVDHIARTRQLRFIRSGSAPMPAGVPQELERVFNSKYVEACGATECSAYICSNSPSDRKIGSVGKPMPGNEVLIINADGKPLGPKEEGEIIARGPGVFAGYESRPDLAADTFHNGYFRTGDLGYYDDDGFFYLTGRLKEQINRAGMKISPREVDDAMAQHPAIHMAAAFSVKDELLGEEVHAAVVLKPNATLAALDLQRFLASRLADYKMPRVIHFVPSIPTNATGKIVRVKLAEKLGIQSTPTKQIAEKQIPTTPTQLAIAAMFSRILKTTVDDIHFDFRAAGGDSMQAMDLSLELERSFKRQIPVSAITSHATVRELAELIENDGWRAVPAAPVVFRASSGTRPTLFCLPGVGGNVWCYSQVAAALPDDQPVVGLPLPGTDGFEAPLDNLDALVTRFVSSIRAIQPKGPYLLAGYSFGGRIAFEVCRRLASEGDSIANLILVDTAGPNWPGPLPTHKRLVLHVRRLITQGPMKMLQAARSRRAGRYGLTPDEVLNDLLLAHASRERQKIQLALIEAAATVGRQWKPAPFDVPITLIRGQTCSWKDCDISEESMGWRAISKAPVDVQYVPGSHGSLFEEPDVKGLAMAFAYSLANSRR